MRSISEIDAQYREDIFGGLDEWLDEAYETSFAEYFNVQSELTRRLSDETPITDAELQSILIDIPLKLFEVSEVLNRFKLRYNVIKLNIKKMEKGSVLNSSEGSETHRRDMAVLNTIDDKFLLQAYESLIARVEKELSYSRELIMGAKKIWDGRRSAEEPTPTVVSAEECEESYDLPEYMPASGKAYIK